MQLNTLKLNSRRKRRKSIGRGGKKGTYSGKGMKGQKSRSGAKINPLFEGGRSTLIDRMKKKRGFKSPHLKPVAIKYSDLVKKFENDANITIGELIRTGFLKKTEKKRGVKILGPKMDKKNFSFDKGILLSKSVK
jgi:large subunit ribosomal protein L15